MAVKWVRVRPVAMDASYGSLQSVLLLGMILMDRLGSLTYDNGLDPKYKF